MNAFTRRRLLQTTLGASAALLPGFRLAAEGAAGGLRIAPFRFEVTPPAGHPLCGGWITPVVDCEDALEAIGFVLLGAGQPIVVCAVDWTGILNEAHVAWRTALAEAAGTTPERVAVQCVHQHDAPFVCLRGQTLAAEQKDGLSVVQVDFFDECLNRARAAVRAALPNARPVTHVAHGEAPVDKVASNRRVALGPDGKVLKMRGSACRDPDLVALPEGLIDPMLKTVAFYDGADKIVSCHYYATHPMSHYGKGHVSSDFVGLARKQRQQEDTGCTHLYFTGAAGNIAAGKYNDGTPAARRQLTQRIYKGIVASEKGLQPAAIKGVSWTTHDLVPQVNPVFSADTERALLENKKNAPANRIRPAMRLAWIERIQRRVPIVLSALHVNDITLLHLPAESFLEYQLRAQQFQPGRFVATAAYGDGGPWYIPVKEAFPQGGYEVSVANCADTMDALMTGGIRSLFPGSLTRAICGAIRGTFRQKSCQRLIRRHCIGMLRLLIFVTLPLYVLDQWTKHWIVGRFQLHVDEQEVMPGIFWLHHTANTGVAFGMFNGTEYANWAFGGVALVALALITWMYRTGTFPGWLSKTAVALLVSGILGNLTDRLLHGYVVDFLRFDFGFAPFNPWPSFNVADACVVIAAIMLALASFVEAAPKRAK